MANAPFKAPETLIAAGMTAKFEQQEDCREAQRGERPDAGMATGVEDDWFRSYQLRSEFDRQNGEVQGKSTYDRGTVFAPPPRVKSE